MTQKSAEHENTIKGRVAKKSTKKRPKEKIQRSPFLCVVPSCEIMVSGDIGGFSRETALTQHLNMHLKKGEVLDLSSHSLVAYCRCAAVKLKAQKCQVCGQVKNSGSRPTKPSFQTTHSKRTKESQSHWGGIFVLLQALKVRIRAM